MDNKDISPGKIKLISITFCFYVKGPGQYTLKSKFDNVKYIKSLDNQGTYLSIENGHLN